MALRVVLALVIGFGVSQLIRSLKNYWTRKDWTDAVGILAALLILLGGVGLFIALVDV